MPLLTPAVGHSLHDGPQCLPFPAEQNAFPFPGGAGEQLPQGPEQVYGLAGQLPFSLGKTRTLLEPHFSIHEMEKVIPLLGLSSM